MAIGFPDSPHIASAISRKIFHRVGPQRPAGGSALERYSCRERLNGRNTVRCGLVNLSQKGADACALSHRRAVDGVDQRRTRRVALWSKRRTRVPSGKGQLTAVKLVHAGSDIARDGRLGHQHQEVQEQERLDAQVVLQYHGCDAEDGFELLGALLERRLILLGVERLLQGKSLVVGDEGEDFIGARQGRALGRLFGAARFAWSSALSEGVHGGAPGARDTLVCRAAARPCRDACDQRRSAPNRELAQWPGRGHGPPDMPLRFANPLHSAYGLSPEGLCLRFALSSGRICLVRTNRTGSSDPLHALHASACPEVEVFDVTEMYTDRRPDARPGSNRLGPVHLPPRSNVHRRDRSPPGSSPRRGFRNKCRKIMFLR
jgi:hypothetical protein